MATKQTDTVAMTEEQLDTVVGGWNDAAGHGCGRLHTGIHGGGRYTGGSSWNVTLGGRNSLITKPGTGTGSIRFRR